MPIEGFDYNNFAQLLAGQAGDLVPANFDDYSKQYVTTTLLNFATLAGEAIYNDTELKFNADQGMLITQIIAEWTFHKSIDIIKSGVPPEHWDSVMQKVAFTIFEIAKQGVSQGMEQEQLLQVVEHHVKQTYHEALAELKSSGVITDALFDKAAHQSNIDDMMEQIQKEKEKSGEGQTAGSTASDAKILKLASVALLLKQVSQEKVQTILKKFNPEDAQAVLQYMQMNDLQDKLDSSIAVKCLQEIKTNLPEPKKISPNKILNKLSKVFKEKGKEKIESTIRKERPYIKKFVGMAQEGEYFPLPSKVANIIVQHLEESA